MMSRPSIWILLAASSALTYLLRALPFIVGQWWRPQLSRRFFHFVDAASYSMLGSIIALPLVEPTMTEGGDAVSQVAEVAAKLVITAATCLLVIRSKRLGWPYLLGALGVLLMLLFTRSGP
ncbi:AzlD domain-containing protein [Sorangium sp. So ce1128]